MARGDPRAPALHSVNALLDRAADRWPTQPAIITDSVTMSYEELQDRVQHLAGGLTACGLSPGDRIAASLPNDADIVVAFYAAARIGAIWVGINQALTVNEKARLLAETTPKVLLSTVETLDSLTSQPAASEVDSVAVDVDGRWAELCSGTPIEHDPVDPTAPAAVAFTSGTSGDPKGVVHSQHNLVLPGEVLSATRSYDSSFRRGDCLPLTILNLMVLSILTAAQVGGTSVLRDGGNAATLADWIRRNEINLFSTVPTTFYDLVWSESVAPSDLACLREVWSGGAACPQEVRDRFFDRFGLPLHGTYGLTEAPSIVAIDPVGDPSPPGASGLPLPHLDVRLGEKGREWDGGEILVGAATAGRWAGAWRPPLGYWNRPDNAVPVAAGRLHTGDLGRLEHGRLVVLDRLGSVIIRGGANVYPAEVERVLRDLTPVADAVVVGLPDERLGETVHALVELKPNEMTTEQKLVDGCRGALARYKLPVRILIVEALARNAMGKPDQRAARTRLMNETA